MILMLARKTIFGTMYSTCFCMDCVIGNMSIRYESIHALESMFGFLWKYLSMNESEVEEKA